jgi:hypothetical protein
MTGDGTTMAPHVQQVLSTIPKGKFSAHYRVSTFQKSREPGV